MRFSNVRNEWNIFARLNRNHRPVPSLCPPNRSAPTCSPRPATLRQPVGTCFHQIVSVSALRALNAIAAKAVRASLAEIAMAAPSARCKWFIRTLGPTAAAVQLDDVAHLAQLSRHCAETDVA